jgi:hypothetical protein
MQRFSIPNYRQQRAIESIDRASAELSIAIQTHAHETDTVRQALRELVALTDSIKAVIVNGEG